MLSVKISLVVRHIVPPWITLTIIARVTALDLLVNIVWFVRRQNNFVTVIPKNQPPTATPP